mmetsp:Transcript_7806/g.17052  ORF Transcript_7806/g.17052 Transcript_7806/m.17052 type:complete len:201 (-) Transcript_7806:243-845(-)
MNSRVMLFNLNSSTCKLHSLCISDAQTLTILVRGWDILYWLTSTTPMRVHHFHLLATNYTTKRNFVETKLICWLMDQDLVRVHSSLNHIFSKAVRTSNKYSITVARFCVNAEHDSTCSKIRADHQHNTTTLCPIPQQTPSGLLTSIICTTQPHDKLSTRVHVCSAKTNLFNQQSEFWTLDSHHQTPNTTIPSIQWSKLDH